MALRMQSRSPGGEHGCTHLSHHLLPPRICTVRMLELRARIRNRTTHSDMGCGYLSHCLGYVLVPCITHFCLSYVQYIFMIIFIDEIRCRLFLPFSIFKSFSIFEKTAILKSQLYGQLVFTHLL